MKTRRPFFVAFTMLAICFAAHAQCIDSLRINPTAPCNTDYTPVCGCNQVTYRNICYAQYRSGLVGTYTEGPCSGFEFDVFPTIVSSDTYYNLTITFVQNTGQVAHLVVVDHFGKQVYQRTLPALTQFVDAIPFQLDVSGYRPGTYIVFIYNAQSAYRYKKFVRY